MKGMIDVSVKNADLFERVGCAADRIDNLLAARSFMPITAREKSEPALLKDIRDELRQIVVHATGVNPWEGHPEA